MNTVDKYKNLENELPKLPKVLLNTIQSDVLELKQIQKDCEKYINACAKINELEKADYVIYSKYVKKSDHKYEKFIFLDKDGAEVCNVSGQKMELYGLLSCATLPYSEEYEASLHSESSSRN